MNSKPLIDITYESHKGIVIGVLETYDRIFKPTELYEKYKQDCHLIGVIPLTQQNFNIILHLTWSLIPRLRHTHTRPKHIHSTMVLLAEGVSYALIKYLYDTTALSTEALWSSYLEICERNKIYHLTFVAFLRLFSESKTYGYKTAKGDCV